MSLRLDSHAAQQIRKLRCTKAMTIIEMAKEIGEDITTFFEDEDWSGLDLRGCDLKGVSFANSDMDRVIIYKDQEKLIRSSHPKTMRDAVVHARPEALDAFFADFSEQLKAQVGPDVFASWFARLKLRSVTESAVHFSVPTTFLKSWIENRYVDLLLSLVQTTRPAITLVKISVQSSRYLASSNQTFAQDATEDDKSKQRRGRKSLQTNFADTSRENNPQPNVQRAKSDPLFGSPLDRRFKFENFVEGASNRVAAAASKTIAEGERGAARFNPLFIHGAVGCGKTHLLQAIANAAIDSPSNPRVVYLTAEYFMWRFATAIRENDALTLKETLRNIDLLVIDDMQFLQGKMIQHEFHHLLNMLLDSAKKVVVAADRAPWELESLDPRVRSRLQGGMAIEIKGLDKDMRYSVLTNWLKEARRDDPSVDISHDILRYLADTAMASGRELEGAFNQLIFRRSIVRDLSLDHVDELLSHLARTYGSNRVSIEEIQHIVAKHYNVSRQELVSNSRTRGIVKPRQIAMFLAKTLTPRSFPEIGRRFGGRDHTTVLHAVRKIEALISVDEILSHEVELLGRLIKNNQNDNLNVALNE